MSENPSTRKVILQLLTAAGPTYVPVQGLVYGMSLLGVNENCLRVTLARLKQERLVELGRRGEYRLGPAARAMSEEIAGWRQLEEKVEAWDGTWIGVHTAGLSSQRKVARQRQRALKLLGFRQWCAGLELRPNNLSGGIERTRDRLRNLGLESQAPIFRLSDWNPAPEKAITKLWSIEKLHRQYTQMIERLESSVSHFPHLTLEEAGRESFWLGSEAIRLLLLDPLLPPPLCREDLRRRLRDTMIHYDRQSRQIWEQIIQPVSPLPTLSTPYRSTPTQISAFV
jgi:phenylacetic acid degradation operon negative regulatory protein